MSKKIEKFEDFIAWQKFASLMSHANEVGQVVGGLRVAVARRHDVR